MHRHISQFALSFSGLGVLLGTLFLAASFAPSLIPRNPVFQGVLTGMSAALGYGFGVFLRWLWDYLELPTNRTGWDVLALKIVASVACGGIALFFLWNASEWQNSIRLLMGLSPVETSRPYTVGCIALAVFLILVLIGRLFALMIRWVSGYLSSHVPRRVSNILALVVVSAIFWMIGNGVLVSQAVGALDASYRQFDTLVEDGIRPPEEPGKTGSPASLIAWKTLGRAGREVITSPPTQGDIAAFTGRPALEPIRVYVGVASAETVRERAQLALEELIRVGGFERSVLVIATPTGTGWLDPASQRSLEYLENGDVATVTVQYSHLPSWLALLVDPDIGDETARAVFDLIYDYWHRLPRDARPRLYLHGLSLGALNSDLSANLLTVIDDPFQGAFWAGPPFQTPTWRQMTNDRNPGSPAWLPRVGEGALVRFTNQTNHLNEATAPWGLIRIIYLQYASDPITFFSPSYAYTSPEWLADRGPDVSPKLRWYPIVTFLQLVLDMMTATTTPMGYGHVYAPEHYVDGWVALTEPPGWTAPDIDRLKRKLAAELRNKPVPAGP